MKLLQKFDATFFGDTVYIQFCGTARDVMAIGMIQHRQLGL